MWIHSYDAEKIVNTSDIREINNNFWKQDDWSKVNFRIQWWIQCEFPKERVSTSRQKVHEKHNRSIVDLQDR